MAFKDPATLNKQPKKSNRPKGKRQSSSKHWWNKHKWLTGILAVLLTLGIGLTSWSYYSANQTANAANRLQTQAQKASKQTIAKQIDDTGNYKYGGQNSGIPNASQLEQYRQSPGTLTTWGYAGANVQPGLKNPLKSLPINEGASNKVLAYGYGTAEPGYFMGQGNNVLAIHNFADGVTFGSPLQYIDVTAKPRFYQTNGKKIFTYQLTRRHKVPRLSSEYAQAVKQTAENKVTLVTCDEPNMVVNLYPNSRIIVTGELVQVQNFKEVPKTIKAIFPQLMR